MKINMNGIVSENNIVGVEVINGNFKGKLVNGTVDFGSHSLSLGIIINEFLFRNGFDKAPILMENEDISNFILGSVESVKCGPMEEALPLYQNSFTIDKVSSTKFIAENSEFFIMFDLFNGMIIVDKKRSISNSLSSDNVILVRGKTIGEIISNCGKTMVGGASVVTEAPGLPPLVVIDKGVVLSGTTFLDLAPAPYDLDGNVVLHGVSKEWVDSIENKESVKVEPKDVHKQDIKTDAKPVEKTTDENIKSVLDGRWKELIALGYRGSIDDFRNEYASHIATYGAFDKKVFFANYTKNLLDKANKEDYELVKNVVPMTFEEFVEAKNNFLKVHEKWDIELFLNKNEKKEIPQENTNTSDEVKPWGEASNIKTDSTGTTGWGDSAWKSPAGDAASGDTPWGGMSTEDILNIGDLNKVDVK